MLTEKPHRAISVCIHLVHQRLGVLRQTRREDDQFVVLRHHLQEVLDSGSLLDEDVADSALDVDWDDEVRILDGIELTVYQSFIQIQHQSLHAFAPFRRRSQHPDRLLLRPVIRIPHHVASLGL